MGAALFFRIRRFFGGNLPVRIRAIAGVERLAFGEFEGCRAELSSPGSSTLWKSATP
jgi:hypothetical protein